MKTTHPPTGLSLRKALALLVAALLGTALPAQATLLFAGVDLGAAGRTTQWAVFALSGGITVSDTSLQGPPYDAGPGTPTISSQTPGQAHIGVAGGSITLSGRARVDGNAYIKTGGVLRRSGTANVNGGVVQSGANDTLMNQVVSDANAARIAANGLANYEVGVTRSGWITNGTVDQNQNQNFSLTDNTSGANVVLHLTDFILSGGYTFTLSGTAATTYIINISGKFSLLGGKVVLAGGVLPENVLFNVTGSGADISLTSAAEFNGFILATNRTLNMSGGSLVTGTIVAGKVNISGASRVVKPNYVSP